MQLIIFILVILVPVAEIFLLIKLGGLIGLWPTVGIIVGTAVAGIVLAKTQKTRTIQRAQKAMLEGKPPTDAVMDGLVIMISGTLLVIPGLITDAVGLLLLLPPVRAGMRKRVASAVVNRAMGGAGGGEQPGSAWADDETVIDADVIDE